MARKGPAEHGKKTRPQTKNSPAITPRRKPVRKIELEAAPRPLEPSKQVEPYPIVGLGASAGGFEAFRELLKALPSDTGMALVLVQLSRLEYPPAVRAEPSAAPVKAS